MSVGVVDDDRDRNRDRGLRERLAAMAESGCEAMAGYNEDGSPKGWLWLDCRCGRDELVMVLSDCARRGLCSRCCWIEDGIMDDQGNWLGKYAPRKPALDAKLAASGSESD